MERSDFEKGINEFFPMTWKKLKKSENKIETSSRLYDLEKTVKKYIKNLNLEIRLDKTDMVNAYTCPLMETEGQVWTSIIPIVGTIYSMYKALGQYKDNVISKMKVKNGMVVFPKSDIKVLVFVTNGLMKKLNERELVSVILHEIGHWEHLNKTLIKDLSAFLFIPIFSGIEYIMYPSVFMLFLVMTITSRASEFDADKFTKNAGFGKDLSNSLKKIDPLWKLEKKQNKIKNMIERIFIKLFIIFANIVGTHPTTGRRIKRLLEIDLSKIIEKIKYYIKPLTKILDIMISKLLRFILPA